MTKDTAPHLTPGAGAVRMGMRGQPRVVVGLAVVFVLLSVIVAAIVAGPRVRSPQQVAADAAPPTASLVTVRAQRRVLAEPVVLRGQVKPGPSVALLPPASAVGENSVITGVVVKVGQTLREGQVVAVRSGEPMFTLVLAFPLYRDITGGLSGPDVAEVQRAMNRLTYRIRVTGEFDAATQHALSRLYTDRGYAPPRAGPEAQAQLAAARKAVNVIQQRFDDAVRAGADVTAAQAELNVARRTLSTAELGAGPMVSRSAVLRMAKPVQQVTAVDVTVGSVLADPKAPILDLDGEPAYITAVAARDQVGLLTVGQEASVFDDAAGATAGATVVSVGSDLVSVAGGTGFEVRLRFSGTVIGTGAERSVRVDVAPPATIAPVLAVPVTGVYSRPDNTTFVTVADAQDATTEVEVTTGRVAGGWVEVQPHRPELLGEGTLVVVGTGGIPETGPR